MSDLPKGWGPTTIGTLCDLINGRAFKPDDWSETGLPIIRIQNLNNREAKFNYYSKPVDDKFVVRHGDLLFAWSGTPGTSFGAHIWNGKKAILNQHIFNVRYDHKAIDCSFFRYAINQTLDEQIAKAHGGVGLRHVTRGMFEETEIALPPLAEQRRIVAKIDNLSSKSKRAREHLDHIPRLVDKYKQAILAAAFRGELTNAWRLLHRELETASALVTRTPNPDQSRGGRGATTRVKPGVAGLSVNDPGTVPPKKWCWVSLRRIARQETGHTPSRKHSDYWDGGIAWIGIRDAGAHHGKIIMDTMQKASAKGLENSSARLLPKDTVCLSRTASVGYVTIMGRSMATSQDFATWTCSSALVPKYLMYALMAEGENIREFGEGSTHTTIYFPEIRALHICLAPLAEQNEIVRRIEHAFTWIDRLAKEATSARKLVDVLDKAVFAKAFRGELVPQDPNDEPAGALLARIRAERAAAPAQKRKRAAK